MAQTAKPCGRCGKPHFNFQKCEVRSRERANQSLNVSIRNTTPNLPEGYRVWGQDKLDEYEQHGRMIVKRSGFVLRPHGGKIIEPKEQE